MKNFMNLSEASNLAIHALGILSDEGRGRPLSAAQLAADIQVSESHLAKVLQRLANAGILGSSRGAHGGFYFRRKPEELTLLDIVYALDGPMIDAGCLLGHPMGRPMCTEGACRLRNLSTKIQGLIRDELASIRLSEFTYQPAAWLNGNENNKGAHNGIAENHSDR